MACRSPRPTHDQHTTTEAAHSRAVSIADACTEAGVPEIIAGLLLSGATDQEVAAAINAAVTARDLAEAARQIEAGQTLH